MSTHNQYQRGFTLVELVVVMAILSLLSITGYRVFQSAISIRQDIQVRSEQLREFELGLFIVARDLSQIQTSPIPAQSSPFTMGQAEPLLFTFFQSPNAELLTGLRQTSYLFRDNTLIQQQQWAEQTQETVIINHIQSLTLTFYDDDAQPSAVWTNHDRIPHIIEIRFTHDRYGEIILKEMLDG